jgi:hypothetical protein
VIQTRCANAEANPATQLPLHPIALTFTKRARRKPANAALDANSQPRPTIANLSGELVER